jgi:rubredoxin-NAD+ reductase
MSTPAYRKWQCIACGDIYDEALGSPLDGIPPGTRFEDLPDDWMCPNCGALKASFVLM